LPYRDPAPWAGPPPADTSEHRLVADVSHELKSPLSIMLALCGRLEDSGRLERRDAADVARIRANAYTMLRQVQDLALMSRLEGAEAEAEAELVDVASIVTSCVEDFSVVARERRQHVTLDVPERLTATIDAGKFVSVVSNLVANAIRYTPDGGLVRISLRTRPGELTLEVADSGPGVPLARRQSVFDRYAHGRNSDGSGLGLAIVRAIAELHGGQATVAQAPEGGALFVVTLPLVTPAGAAPRSTRSLAIGDRQKALIEDLRARIPS
jgi:signal transduction histidine kinase